MKKILAVVLAAVALLCGVRIEAQTANANYPEVWIMPSYAADTGAANVLVATVTSVMACVLPTAARRATYTA